MKDQYEFELLTPCFCHGAFPEEVAEMRVPSIRGHLRRWHRLLYGEEDMKQTWGTAGREVVSSRVILRLMTSDGKAEEWEPQQVLPHAKRELYGKREPHAKREQKTFSRSALKSGMSYRLLVSFRPLTSEQVRERVDQVITSWLYLGCVGMRSTRAFGSVWPKDKFPDLIEFSRTVKTAAEKLAIKVSVKTLSSPNLAICSDTLSGAENEQYFGYVHGKERLTSPLKMKYIRLADGFHLVLYAECDAIISGALMQLREHKKPLGGMEFKSISAEVRR